MKPKSEIFNIDCLDYMRGLPDNAFELVIADPPYGGAGNEQIEGGRFGQRFDRYKQASTSNSTAPVRKTECLNTESAAMQQETDSTDKTEPG